MKVAIGVLPAGFIGYKGASYTAEAWSPVTYADNTEDNKDWSGLYIAAEEDTAKGYLPDMVENGSGDTYIHKVGLIADTKVVTCLDPDFQTGNINMNSLKTALRNEGITVEDHELLIPRLGKLGYLFKCYNNEEGEFEIIVPNSMVKKGIIQMHAYKKCEIKNYEIRECKHINPLGR